jgi:hypothetical protein
MVANGDKDMAEILEGWEHTEDEGLVFDFNQDEYDQFLLEKPKLEEEPPKEECAEPVK